MNVYDGLRREIKGKLGIKAVSNLGTYFSIPSFRGKIKCLAFGYVLDRVKEKLKCWKQQALSYGGKEILFKVVVCAVPMYIMACFKFLKKICSLMNATVASVWWGQKEEKMRIHWKSWLRMSILKSLRGMGFKDLCIFYVALLAKQS